MQDAACLNFGCLNDEELNLMLKHDDNMLVPNSSVFSFSCNDNFLILI